MELSEMKQVFIDSAVHVVARDGLVKATTKAIAAEAELNEVYIYRCFENKEELLSAAFHQEDVNFVRHIRKTLPVMHMENLTWKERCFLLWRSCWNFILEKPDDLLFYLRYYYSASCRKYAYANHLRCFEVLIQEVRHVFKPETNVTILVHQIFDTMFSFAARVQSGEIKNDETTTNWTFEQVYSFVVPNVLTEIVEEKHVEAEE